MSTVAGFGQKRRSGFELAQKLIRRAEFTVTGRMLFVAAAVGFVLLIAGMAMVWGFRKSGDSTAPQPAIAATIYEQHPDELAETTKDLKITQQETVDQLQVVQDLVASQQAEMKKLSDQVAALSAELDLLKQAAPPVISPKAALSKTR
jgi:ABC-type lipoprotein release transport system permease subunit